MGRTVGVSVFAFRFQADANAFETGFSVIAVLNALPAEILVASLLLMVGGRGALAGFLPIPAEVAGIVAGPRAGPAE